MLTLDKMDVTGKDREIAERRLREMLVVAIARDISGINHMGGLSIPEFKALVTLALAAMPPIRVALRSSGEAMDRAMEILTAMSPEELVRQVRAACPAPEQANASAPLEKLILSRGLARADEEPK